MLHRSQAAGLAALSICESLLLSLTENKIIDTAEARVILEDAATAHRNAVPEETDGKPHADAASIIELILQDGNSVRRR
jgi:hypothetical protein